MVSAVRLVAALVLVAGHGCGTTEPAGRPSAKVVTPPAGQRDYPADPTEGVDEAVASVSSTTAAPASSVVTTTTPPPRAAAPERTSRSIPPAPAPAAAPVVLEAESTAYCLTGNMANGEPARQGAVAMGTRADPWPPLGTVVEVSDSPWGPGRFVVEDRIGHSSQLDFAMPGDCGGAVAWGRRPVTATVWAGR